MRPISIDLRIRIVAAVEGRQFSLRELAERFSVHLSTIVRLLQRFRSTTSVQPKAHGGGARRKLDAGAVARLLEAVRPTTRCDARGATQPTGDRLQHHDDPSCLAASSHHPQEKTQHAQERDTPRVQKQRRVFRKKMATVAPEHLVFVDETGATTAMGRTYGRAPAGERVGGVPRRLEECHLDLRPAYVGRGGSDGVAGGNGSIGV